MPVRLPRVEVILGARIDQLTVEHIRAAAVAGVEESSDLDFKEEHYEDTKREELAKDVAAFANHVGGLLVIGVREQQLCAVELTAVSLANDPVSRYRQILAGRITPYVRDVDISPARDAGAAGEALVATTRPAASSLSVDLSALATGRRPPRGRPRRRIRRRRPRRTHGRRSASAAVVPAGRAGAACLGAAERRARRAVRLTVLRAPIRASCAAPSDLHRVDRDEVDQQHEQRSVGCALGPV
jgi:hypothetical protein